MEAQAIHVQLADPIMSVGVTRASLVAYQGVIFQQSRAFQQKGCHIEADTLLDP